MGVLKILLLDNKFAASNKRGDSENELDHRNIISRASSQAALTFFIGHVIQANVMTTLMAPANHNGSCILPVA